MLVGFEVGTAALGDVGCTGGAGAALGLGTVIGAEATFRLAGGAWSYVALLLCGLAAGSNKGAAMVP